MQTHRLDFADEAEVTRRILGFATFLAGADPEMAARRRRWVDETGRPTGDGLDLVRAIADQRETRSTLRGI